MYYLLELKEQGPNRINSRETFDEQLAIEMCRELNLITDKTTDFVRYRPFLASKI